MDDKPKATRPAFVSLVEVTRNYSATEWERTITLVTAAGHRLELAPWVIDALRQELTQ